MLYVHTIGRIGKDCQVITGTHGSFIAFDMAVDDYSHGNSVTTWIRVRSKKENHIRLSEYLTKGRLLLIEGTLSASLWKDKDENSQIQLSISRHIGVHQYRKTGGYNFRSRESDRCRKQCTCTTGSYAARGQGRLAVLMMCI